MLLDLSWSGYSMPAIRSGWLFAYSHCLVDNSHNAPCRDWYSSTCTDKFPAKRVAVLMGLFFLPHVLNPFSLGRDLSADHSSQGSNPTNNQCSPLSNMAANIDRMESVVPLHHMKVLSRYDSTHTGRIEPPWIGCCWFLRSYAAHLGEGRLDRYNSSTAGEPLISLLKARIRMPVAFPFLVGLPKHVGFWTSNVSSLSTTSIN